MKEFLRFVSLEGISLGIKFKIRDAVEAYEQEPFLEYKIASATPSLGFDKHGNYIAEEKYHLLDNNDNPVIDFDEAFIIAAGNIFEAKTIIDPLPNFTITVFESVMFKKEFKAFSEFINSGYLEKVFTEVIK